MNAPLSSFFPQAVVVGVTSVLVSTLVACGGGGSASTANTNATASGTTETYTGTVSGLGSIVVNGVRFSTTGATTSDGDDPSVSYTKSFALGTTVTVKGTVDDSSSTGQASSIEVIGGVRGKVTAVDLTAQTLTVSGQTIQVDADTVFDGNGSTPFTLDTIATDVAASTAVYVEAYGVADANNVIKATRIEKKDPAALVYAIKGYVVAGTIDTSAKQFNMLLKRGNSVGQTVTVNYANATLLPAGVDLSDGIAVRVLSATDPSGQTNVTATKVLVRTDRQVDGAVAKIRGVVSAINGSTWTIGDISVDVSKSPVLVGINSLSDVTAGTTVRVGGLFTSNNVLVAKIIEADHHDRDRDGGNVKLFGVATGVDTNARTFAIQGVSVTVPSNLTLPSDGNYVEVVAQQVNGVLTAVHISSTSNSGSTRPFEVFGLADCTNGVADIKTTFTLTLPLGSVTVNGSNALVEVERRVSMDASTSAKTCMLEVKGTLAVVNDVKTITASKIEIKTRQ